MSLATGRAARLGAVLCASILIVLPAGLATGDDGVPEAFDPGPVMRLSIGGEPFGYRTVGTGPPLVLIMGFGGTMAEWDPALVSELARFRRVILFDNRGVAESAGASVRGLTIGKMAEDAAAVIRKLTANRRADVLGWSMGGYIAQKLVVRHPARVRRLVLAATDPGGRRAKRPSAEVLEILDDPDTPPAELVRVLFPPDREAAAEAYVERVAAWPGIGAASFEVPPRTFAAQRVASERLWWGRGGGVLSRLASVRTRALVAGGKQDVVVPPGNSRLIARRLPRSKLRLYPDSGHAFGFQLHHRFAHAVEELLG